MQMTLLLTELLKVKKESYTAIIPMITEFYYAICKRLRLMNCKFVICDSVCTNQNIFINLICFLKNESFVSNYIVFHQQLYVLY